MPTGDVSFRLISITVHDIDGTPDTGLTTAFASAIPAALDTALNDQLFQSGPTRLQVLTTCNPTTQNADARRLVTLNNVFATPQISPSSIVLRQDQVRCHADSPQSTTRGHCQFKPLVARTQEYPEGIELVLSDRLDDQTDRLLALDGATHDQYCSALQPPTSFENNGVTTGTLRVLLSP